MNKRFTLIASAAAAILCVIVRRPVCICAILALCVIALAVERFVSAKREERALRVLTNYITAVQDDLSLPAVEGTAEGEFGILQSEVYKVVALLREKYAREKKQTAYMSDMLSDISHQIKTPLTAIQLMTELLEQPEVEDGKRLQYAEKIDLQVTRITWLVRNLLAISQMEAGVLKMKQEPIGLDALAARLHESLDVMAELKGVALDIALPAELTVTGDEYWLCEALLNIVKNCIEHTDASGTVRVSAERNSVFTRVTVEDNGCGIGEKDLPHIFERFYKAENASAQSVGIGLSLAKQIVSTHNGTLTAESAPGEGTRFTMKLYHAK